MDKLKKEDLEIEIVQDPSADDPLVLDDRGDAVENIQGTTGDLDETSSMYWKELRTGELLRNPRGRR